MLVSWCCSPLAKVSCLPPSFPAPVLFILGRCCRGERTSQLPGLSEDAPCGYWDPFSPPAQQLMVTLCSSPVLLPGRPRQGLPPRARERLRLASQYLRATVAHSCLVCGSLKTPLLCLDITSPSLPFAVTIRVGDGSVRP